jgi:hypothetical protein
MTTLDPTVNQVLMEAELEAEMEALFSWNY